MLMKTTLILLILQSLAQEDTKQHHKNSIKLKRKSVHHKPHTPKKFLSQGVLVLQNSFQLQEEEYHDDSIQLMLQKHENFYLAEMQVGTPAQNFQILIDSGSPNFVLTSSLCQQDSCLKHGTYKPQLSSTSYYIEAIQLANGEIGNEIDIQFASGSVEGVFFEDRVCLNQFCVEDQLIVGIVQESEDIFSLMKFDGILGLGRVSEAVVKNASFINNIKLEGGINNFSLYLSSHEDDTTHSSELILGGVSQNLIYPGEQFEFFQLSSENFWTIRLQEIYLGSQRIDNCGIVPCQALFDSGTSFVSLASFPMGVFRHKFGPYQNCEQVEQLPDLIFVFDRGISFSLTATQYFKKNIHSVFQQEMCIPFVKESPILSEKEQLFVLGQPFLTRHYIWFDEFKQRVGIAKSKQFE